MNFRGARRTLTYTCNELSEDVLCQYILSVCLIRH